MIFYYYVGYRRKNKKYFVHSGFKNERKNEEKRENESKSVSKLKKSEKVSENPLT